MAAAAVEIIPITNSLDSNPVSQEQSIDIATLSKTNIYNNQLDMAGGNNPSSVYGREFGFEIDSVPLCKGIQPTYVPDQIRNKQTFDKKSINTLQRNLFNKLQKMEPAILTGSESNIYNIYKDKTIEPNIFECVSFYDFYKYYIVFMRYASRIQSNNTDVAEKSGFNEFVLWCAQFGVDELHNIAIHLMDMMAFIEKYTLAPHAYIASEFWWTFTEIMGYEIEKNNAFQKIIDTIHTATSMCSYPKYRVTSKGTPTALILNHDSPGDYIFGFSDNHVVGVYVSTMAYIRYSSMSSQYKFTQYPLQYINEAKTLNDMIRSLTIYDNTLIRKLTEDNIIRIRKYWLEQWSPILSKTNITYDEFVKYISQFPNITPQEFIQNFAAGTNDISQRIPAIQSLFDKFMLHMVKWECKISTYEFDFDITSIDPDDITNVSEDPLRFLAEVKRPNARFTLTYTPKTTLIDPSHIPLSNYDLRDNQKQTFIKKDNPIQVTPWLGLGSEPES